MDRSRFRLDDPAMRARLVNRAPRVSYERRPAMVSRVIDINAPVPTPAHQSQLFTSKPAIAPAKVTPISQHFEQPTVTARLPETRVDTSGQGTADTFSQTVSTIVEPPQQKSPPKAKRQKSTIVLYAMASFLLLIGIAVSVNGFIVNRHVSATVAHLSAASNGTSDDKEPPPSTVKPSDSDIKNYTVAPNMARYITIPKIGVFARVLNMGVTSKNQLRAPSNVYDAGWYNGSSLPGQPGASLIDGHVSSWSTHGVFYGLNKLVTGDDITITKGDGQQLTFSVVKAEIVPSDKVNMASLLVSQDTAKPGLNLISCAGDVVPGTNEFDKRIVVYATLKQ